MTGSSSVGNENTGEAGFHAHLFTIPAHASNSTKRTSDDSFGDPNGETATASNMPSFQEVIFCEKD